MSKIYNYVLNKFSDLFPVGGGAIGAVTQIDKIEQTFHWPQADMIVSTIIIAAIGAIVGYLVKLLFDIIFCNTKKKFNLKNNE